MKKIDKIIEENKKEAIEIVKNHGGRINFVGYGFIPADERYCEGWEGDIEDVDECPRVSMYVDGSGYDDFAALAVKVENDDILFFGFDIDAECSVDWFTTDLCEHCSENEIYEYLGNHFGSDENK